MRASRGRPRRLAMAAGVILSITACGTVGGGEEISGQEASLVELGEALYETHCSECHGADLRGNEQGPSLLSEIYEPNHHADGAFLLAVRRGVPAHHWRFGDMPPIEGLTEADVEAVVAFVRETQRVEGFEP